MLTLKDISTRYALSPKQTRRVWEAVSPLLAPYTQRGPHNVTLISEQAIPVLDRFMELLREGLSVPAASERLHKEMKSSGLADGALLASNGHSDPRDELIRELRDRISALERDKAYLQAKLDEALARIPALPPPSPPISRWRALRIAILGR